VSASSGAPLVKICGLTRVDDAIACAALGVDAIGLNLWPGSPRCTSLEVARRITSAVGAQLRVVLVLVDPGPGEVERARERTGARWAQLHGSEPAALVSGLLPEAMKAVALGDEGDLSIALAMPGDEILVDARVDGRLGGTGVLAPRELAARVSSARKTWLAGGLRPENVAAAIRAVRPHGVDVASGVESAPGVKDLEKVRAFVRAVRAVAGSTPEPASG
jgi:phosphoribosylanthranilate isomerase